MNKKNFNVVIMMFIMMFFSTISFSGVIIDTGEPSPNQNGGMTLSTQVYRAAEFYLDENMILTDIKGWLGNSQGSLGYGPGSITIAIYDDGGNIPGTELFSSALYIPPTDQNAWHGLSGLSWALTSGEYWLSFEVRASEGQNFNGYMQRNDIPNALTNYAAFDNYFLSSTQGQWIQSDFTRFAAQINGHSYIVPEPISPILFFTGGILLVVIRNKNNKIMA